MHYIRNSPICFEPPLAREIIKEKKRRNKLLSVVRANSKIKKKKREKNKKKIRLNFLSSWCCYLIVLVDYKEHSIGIS